MYRSSIFSALVLGLLCVQTSSARKVLQSEPQPEYFVEIRDGQFVVGCDNFKVAGWNQWYVSWSNFRAILNVAMINTYWMYLLNIQGGG